MDPVTLQLLMASLRSICDEMGAVLIMSAHSANIKERHDCSTALFSSDGQMVMQAEHIPVHLGSMPDSVAAFTGRSHRPGDIYAVNDPFRGGTHLPDITLVSPLMVDGELLGFAASRAHHADVGGMSYGSMPAISSDIYQEGLVIPPLPLVEQGEINRDVLELLMANMRNRHQREADLKAQIAANACAAKRVEGLCRRHSKKLVLTAQEQTLSYAERRACAAIERIPDGSYTAEDYLEDGSEGRLREIPIRATVTVAGPDLTVDFEGTPAVSGTNLNCPLSVTKAAVYFAVKVVTDPDIPPSAGSVRPVKVVAPEGCLVNARAPAAVVAGNVETSSRIADVVLLALGQALPVPAQGQGTMNNLSLGNESFTYYETVGGGQGACTDADGPSAIHVAMTNTLNTPIEALELEHPLRVKRYGLRRGSGGGGKFKGGEGIVREIEALEPMSYSLLSERRIHSPRGSKGGEDGSCGRNLINGEPLPSKASGKLAAGDCICIETPGGGGYGQEA